MNLPAIVYAAARRLTDHGLRARVIADETAREMAAAQDWLEAQWRLCPTCGELVGDRRNDNGHLCSRGRRAS